MLVLASQAGVAIENARLYEDAERRARWLDAVRDITDAVLIGAGAEEVLPIVARDARALVDADLATVATPTGPDDLEVPRRRWCPRRGPRRDALLAGDIDRRRRDGDRPAGVRVGRDRGRAYWNEPVVRLPDMGPAAVVPLGTADATSGPSPPCARAAVRTSRPPTCRCWMRSRARRAWRSSTCGRSSRWSGSPVLEDRERIAKELHDGVIQALFAVGMGLQGAAAMRRRPELSRGSRTPSRRSTGRSATCATTSSACGRASWPTGSWTRRCASSPRSSRKADVRHRRGRRRGVAAELASSAADVVQLTREALSNVGRHAGADTCRVSLRRNGTGRGARDRRRRRRLRRRPAVAGAMGLANLEDRVVATSAGRSRSRARTDEGTTVRALIPL